MIIPVVCDMSTTIDHDINGVSQAEKGKDCRTISDNTLYIQKAMRQDFECIHYKNDSV